MGLASSQPAARDTTFTPATPGILRVATSLPAPGFWNGADAESVSGGLEDAMAREFATRWGLQLEIVVTIAVWQIIAGVPAKSAGVDVYFAEQSARL